MRRRRVGSEPGCAAWARLGSCLAPCIVPRRAAAWLLCKLPGHACVLPGFGGRTARFEGR
eukprot:6317454-Prymnesium_polylepis.1